MASQRSACFELAIIARKQNPTITPSIKIKIDKNIFFSCKITYGKIFCK